MTRLEEIERNLEVLRVAVAVDDAHGSVADLLYALDCYKARVAVLEGAIRSSQGLGIDDVAQKLFTALKLTPEKCLERQNRAYKDSLLVGEEFKNEMAGRPELNE